MRKTDFVQLTRNAKIPDKEFYPMMDSMYERSMQNLLPAQLDTQGMSHTVRNNVVTPPDAPIPDCLTCGACCQMPPCVGVRPSDNVDAEHYWDVTTSGEGGEFVVDRYMRRDGETFACTALEGTLGEHAVCSIYETRPKMCRDFEAGSDRCHALRRAFGIEPFLTLGEMTDGMEKLDAKSCAADTSQTIRNAQIKEAAESGKRVIQSLMGDGTMNQIHTFDPEVETWMQFEFDGLRITEAEALIASRTRYDRVTK